MCSRKRVRVAGIHFNHESPWIPAFAGMTACAHGSGCGQPEEDHHRARAARSGASPAPRARGWRRRRADTSEARPVRPRHRRTSAGVVPPGRLRRHRANTGETRSGRSRRRPVKTGEARPNRPRHRRMSTGEARLSRLRRHRVKTGEVRLNRPRHRRTSAGEVRPRRLRRHPMKTGEARLDRPRQRRHRHPPRRGSDAHRA